MNIRLENRFENIKKETWNTLVLQNKTNTVFQTYEWHIAWWKAFGGNKELFIICIEEQDNLIGIAPLMIYSGKGNKRILGFIGQGASDYSDFIYPEQNRIILGLIFEFIKTQAHKWDEIEFHYIPSDSPSSEIIKNICNDKKMHCFKSGVTICPALIIKDNPDFVQNIRNKQSLIRHRNYFLKKDGYKVIHLVDKIEIMSYLESFFQQHIERWNVTTIKSLFIDHKNRIFYKELTSNMADNNWIIFTAVESETLPIAFHFGFAYSKKFVWYKPSFEISLFKHSPGEVLLKELLDWAILNNFNEFDFTVGDEAFKTRFSNKIRENISYNIFKSYRRYWFCAIKKIMESHKILSPVMAFSRRTRDLYFPKIIEAAKKNRLHMLSYGLLRRLFKEFIFTYNSILFFEIPLGVSYEKQIDLRISKITVRYATIKDLFKFDYFESESEKQKYLVIAFSRFKKGDKCLIAEHLGKIIFLSWICEKENIYIDEVKTNVSIGNNAISIYDCTTVPEYRGKNIYPFMLSNSINMYHDKKKIIYCEEKNIASKKGILKAGFILKKAHFLLKIMGINIRWRKELT